MPSHVTVIKGPNAGRRYPLDDRCTVIGRQPDAGVYLESLAVSRQHAQIIREDGVFSVQDTGSSNGTFVNGHRITGRVPLCERDTLQVGPYELTLTIEQPPQPSDPPQVIRAKVDAALSNQTLFAQNPAHKLQVVLQ